jgi:glycosyltransferase involved in cell wall biosynthesis
MITDPINVLYISWAFPPMGGNGIQRTLKFIKYLPLFGVNPTVLTSSDVKPAGLRDEGLLNEIGKSTRIVKISGDSLLTPLLRVRDDVKAQAKFSSAETGKGSMKNNYGLKQWVIHRFLKPIWRFILNTLVLPDIARPWANRARSEVSRILKEERIDLIYVTGPPFSAFLVGKEAALQSDIPLIIEYRDPWLVPSGRPTNWFKRLIEGKWENSVLHLAKAVVFNNHVIKDAYLDKFELPPEKAHVIPNGFDPAHKEDVVPTREEGKLVFGYTGSFTSQGRTPRYFIDALYKVLSKHTSWHKSIKVKFIGQFWPGDIDYIHSRGLEDCVETIGFLPHSESIKHLAGFDIALIIGETCSGNRNTVPEKVYEYMLFEKPVLALVPEDGASAKIIGAHNMGLVVSVDNVEKIAAGIEDFINRYFANAPLEEKFIDIDKYDCRYLTKKLNFVFRKVLS